VSFFTDFLVAKDTDASAIARAARRGNATSQWPGFSIKSITVLDLANLLGIFRNRTDVQSVVDASNEFAELFMKPSAMIQRFPTEFVHFLAKLTPKELPLTAQKWAATEELHNSLWTPDVVERELLQPLCDLARKAEADKLPILICVSGV
jgi:hypothetical protein